MSSIKASIVLLSLVGTFPRTSQDSNQSVILMSKNSGQTFEKLVEMEGDIKSIVFDQLNNWVYFIRVTNNGSELYRYFL